MQFLKKEIITNIDSYKVFPDVLIYASGDGLKGKQLFVNSKNIGIKGVAGYQYLNNQVIFNQWGVNDSFVYKCSDSSIEVITGGRVQSIIDGYIIFMNVMNDVFIYRDFNLSDVFISKYNFQIIGKDYGIDYNDSQIIKLDFKDIILWQFPLSSFELTLYDYNKSETIDKLLGVVHGNLWFTTKAHKIIALDIETGELVYKSDGFGVYLNEITQDIISIASNIITIIDGKALSIRETYNYIETDPLGIGKYETVYSPMLQGDYFTFLAEKKEDYGGIRHVGIFDYKARKLVWECEVISQQERNEIGNKLIAPEHLYKSGDKLYIKDVKNNLHIFKCEE